MSTLPLLAGALLLALHSPALAADDPLASEDLFIAPLVAGAGVSEEDAGWFTELIAEGLPDQIQPLTLRDVPPFPDYDAATYLEACPEGDRLGCVFVLAGRSEAAWAIDGEVRTAEDGLEASLTFIDVANSRTVFSMSIPATGQDPSVSIPRALSGTVDWILSGGAKVEDLRGEIEDARTAWIEGKRSAEDQAMDLAGMEQELGVALEVGGRAVMQPTELTAEDLQAMVGEDDVFGPWDRLGMDQATYLNYQNSGLELEQWRARQAGRMGSLWLRVLAGAGLSPLGGQLDARIARDPGSTAVLEAESLQQPTTAIGPMGGVDIGLGLAPGVELGASLRLRALPYRWEFTQEYVGDAFPIVLESEQVSTLSTDVGAYLRLLLRPRSPMRPQLALGLASWGGSAVDQHTEPAEDFLLPGRMTRLLLRASPGVEVDLSPSLALVCSLPIELPLGDGRTRVQTGEGALSSSPPELGAPPVAISGLVGLQARIGPLFGPGHGAEEAEEDWP